MKELAPPEAAMVSGGNPPGSTEDQEYVDPISPKSALIDYNPQPDPQ